jgi:uridine kinase
MQPYAIAISGYTGAGKSTVINQLLSLFVDAVALRIDDYGADVIVPPTIEWIKNGANPDEFITPQFTENIRLLKEGKSGIHPADKSEIRPAKYILVEEPFGRSRTVMKPLIDFHVQMDIPPEIALARRVLRNLERLEKDPNSEGVREFLDWYLSAGRQFFILAYELAAKDKDLTVDGLQPSEAAARTIFEAVHAKRLNS